MTCAKHDTKREFCEPCQFTGAKTLPANAAPSPPTGSRAPVGGAADGHRESLGRMVRNVWIAWTKEQPCPKPSWLVPWEGLSEPDREVDRRIGEALYKEGATTPPTPHEAALAALVATVKAWPAASLRLLTEASKLGQPGCAIASRPGRGESRKTGAAVTSGVRESELHNTPTPLDTAAADMDHAFRVLAIATGLPRPGAQ